MIWWWCADQSGTPRRALAALRALLAELGLRPKQAKTRIVHLREGGERFDFLGFHHRYVRRPHLTLASPHLPRSLAITPGDAACPHSDP
jgi:RNA-directed DNA polymerase